ncbi:hypothetical protein [Roseivivax sp. CAU 1761]
MTSLLEPSWPILPLLFAKRFLYVEALALLALIRVFTARGPSRLVAGLTALAALAATAGIFAPAFKLAAGAWYGPVAKVLNAGGGMAVPLALSALFALSMLLPGRRIGLIDVLHLAMFAGLTGLWLATRLT